MVVVVSLGAYGHHITVATGRRPRPSRSAAVAPSWHSNQLFEHKQGICPAHVLTHGLPLASAPVKIPLKYPLYECFGVISEGPRRNVWLSFNAAS